jgi:hypothetical protein
MRRGSREHVVERFSSNGIGQTNIFLKDRLEQDWKGFCQTIDEVFHLTTDPEVPQELIEKWMLARCVTRKTKDDWSGVGTLHRDFTLFTGETCNRGSFQSAVLSAGFAVNRDMVSKLVLKVDQRGYE